MGFYNINPKLVREPQKPQDGRMLKPAGENIVSVIGHLERTSPGVLEVVSDYLRTVVPSVHGVERKQIGPLETLEFRQEVPGARSTWRFPAQNMSDGTLAPDQRILEEQARRYEAWFLAAAASLDGVRGFRVGEDANVDAEAIRNAKGWISKHLESGHYREILDQPALSARFDLEQAFRRSRSFRKPCSEWAARGARSAGTRGDP